VIFDTNAASRKVLTNIGMRRDRERGVGGWEIYAMNDSDYLSSENGI
jgi:hypothetical protein